MLDLQAQRRTKIVLTDYDYVRDIENRLFLSSLSKSDFEILQEVLFSPVRFLLSSLAADLSLKEADVRWTLQKLETTGLLRIKGETVEVDKELRKHFETEMLRFEDSHRIGLDFFFALLRKVPIHILPAWYAIPRSSNNIFDSMVERYFLTPQTFHRYLQEFYLSYPHLEPLVKDLYSSFQLKISLQEIKRHYDLSLQALDEVLLILEFSFIATLRYENSGGEWKQILTPFDEWKEHLMFLRSTQPSPILEEEEVKELQPREFAFVEDLSSLLELVKHKPIAVKESSIGCFLPTGKHSLLKKLGLSSEEKDSAEYVAQIIAKSRLLKFTEIRDGELFLSKQAEEFLVMKNSDKALFLYRHPSNRLVVDNTLELIPIDKIVRETEKSLLRILHAGWVPLEEVVKSVLIPINDEPAIGLKKIGKQWKYLRPEYTERQYTIIELTLYQFLFEVGVVSIGSHNGLPCIKVTNFGASIFAH